MAGGAEGRGRELTGEAAWRAGGLQAHTIAQAQLNGHYFKERKVSVCKHVAGHWYSDTMLVIIMGILRDQAKMQY